MSPVIHLASYPGSFPLPKEPGYDAMMHLSSELLVCAKLSGAIILRTV